MLLPSPFRTTVNFELSVSIGPTSVSHYKWMLPSTPSVYAKRQVDTLHSYREISHSVLSCSSLRDHLSDHNAISSQGEVSRDGLERQGCQRQGCRLEAVQEINEGYLHGRPGPRGEAVCPDTCGRRG